MRLQRGFVLLPCPTATAEPPGPPAPAHQQRRTWRGALGRARFFGAGLSVGTAVWTPVFAAMTDDPGPWGVMSALSLFAVAAVLRRPGHRRLAPE